MGFDYLINLYFIYQYSTRLETSINPNKFIFWFNDFLLKGTFNGKPADYVFCLAFLWLCNTIIGSVLSIYVRKSIFLIIELCLFIWKVLMEAMILSVMYIWCQLNKDIMMSFWFGMQFKAMYMPWVIMLFKWIVSGSYVEWFICFLVLEVLFRFLVQLCGIVVGHLYFFLVFKYPQDFGGARLLQTPNFLYV